jgi:hypothetical protein
MQWCDIVNPQWEHFYVFWDKIATSTPVAVRCGLIVKMSNNEGCDTVVLTFSFF